MNPHKRFLIICGAIAFTLIIIPWLFWLGGLDFTERSVNLAFCMLLTLLCSAGAAAAAFGLTMDI